MNNVTDSGAHEERVSARVDHETKCKLDQVLSTRPRGVTMSDLVREAIESYLNGQEDQIGSRQHFSRSLQRRIDQLEARQANYLNLVIFMQANAFALLVQHLTGDSSRPRRSGAVARGRWSTMLRPACRPCS